MKAFWYVSASVVIFLAMTVEPSTSDATGRQRPAPSPTHGQRCSDYPPYRCYGKTATPIPATPTTVATMPSTATRRPAAATTVAAPTQEAMTPTSTPMPQSSTPQSPATATETAVEASIPTQTINTITSGRQASPSASPFVLVYQGTPQIVRGLPKSGEPEREDQR